MLSSVFRNPWRGIHPRAGEAVTANQLIPDSGQFAVLVGGFKYLRWRVAGIRPGRCHCSNGNGHEKGCDGKARLPQCPVFSIHDLVFP